MKKIYINLCLFLVSLCFSCSDQYLEIFPEDKITTANFPQNEADVKLALNGTYALLRESSIYNEGLFGFGVLDGSGINLVPMPPTNKIAEVFIQISALPLFLYFHQLQ